MLSRLIKRIGINLLFLILPLFFLVLSLNYKNAFTSYSVYCVDPEMAYLYNGLAVAHGYVPHFVDHPGVPLQLISGETIFITHIFRSDTIDTDVFKNPDLYLRIITTVFIFLNVVILWLAGFFTYRIIRSPLAGLFIQLTPFTSLIFIKLSCRILPEYFSLIPVFLMFLISLKYARDYESTSLRDRWRFSFLFALSSAIAISIKMTFLFYFIIPFFVLRSLKEKLRYILFSVLTFGIILIPVWNRKSYFFGWMESLFIHSGQYGGGSATLFDRSIYINNFQIIYHENRLFFWLMGIIALGIIFYIIKRIRIKKVNDVWFRTMIALAFTSLLTALLLAKQYKDYYLPPAILLIIPAFFFFLVIIRRERIFNRFAFPVSLILIGTSLFGFKMKEAYTKIPAAYPERVANSIILQKYKNFPLAVMSDYYGCPFPGYSAHYGLSYSFTYRTKQVYPTLMKLFPKFYSYHNWNGRFNYWFEMSYSLDELLFKYDSIYLYVGNNDLWQKTLPPLLADLNQFKKNDTTIIFSNEKTGERLIRITKLR